MQCSVANTRGRHRDGHGACPRWPRLSPIKDMFPVSARLHSKPSCWFCGRLKQSRQEAEQRLTEWSLSLSLSHSHTHTHTASEELRFKTGSNKKTGCTERETERDRERALEMTWIQEEFQSVSIWEIQRGGRGQKSRMYREKKQFFHPSSNHPLSGCITVTVYLHESTHTCTGTLCIGDRRIKQFLHDGKSVCFQSALSTSDVTQNILFPTEDVEYNIHKHPITVKTIYEETKCSLVW